MKISAVLLYYLPAWLLKDVKKAYALRRKHTYLAEDCSYFLVHSNSIQKLKAGSKRCYISRNSQEVLGKTYIYSGIGTKGEVYSS